MKFPQKNKDIKFLLLKKLNYTGSEKLYDIRKVRKGKNIWAVVYYKLPSKNKNYILGAFKLYKSNLAFVEHPIDNIGELDALKIKTARNRFMKFFNEIKFQFENDLL